MLMKLRMALEGPANARPEWREAKGEKMKQTERTELFFFALVVVVVLACPP